MARKHILRNVPPDRLADLERLREQVRHAEAHDQRDTCHHEMLARLEAELGLIPGKKDMREQQKDEVNNGESDI